MAREKRISLLRFATVVGDVLHLSGPVIHRIFVPLNHLPANGRRQVVRMLGLLDDIRNGDGASMAAKCASILIKGFVDELLSNNLVSRKAVLIVAYTTCHQRMWNSLHTFCQGICHKDLQCCSVAEMQSSQGLPQNIPRPVWREPSTCPS